MTTRKRNIIIASAAAAVIAVAATVTVVTLTPKSDDMIDVGNALAMLNDSETAAPDTPGAPDNETPAVTVSGGADNDTPVVILETVEAAVDGEKDALPDSTNAPADDNGDDGDMNDKGNKDSKDDKGNAEKEDVPDSTAAPSAPSTESKPKSEPKPAPSDSDAPESSKPKADKPAVTVVTNPQAVTAPPSTVRDDLPKVEPEAKYTTSPKAAQTEPTVIDKLDSDGFPANPVDGQIYIDPNGNRWEYVEFIGWGEANGPGVTLQEFPDFYVEGGNEIILT